MKPLFFLLTMACVASLPAADEPKTSPQRSVDEINRQIETLKARMDALDQEKTLLEKKVEEVSKGWTPIQVKEHPEGKFGYIADELNLTKGGSIDPKKFDVNSKAAERYLTSRHFEANGIEYVTPRMGVEMAEQRSAEKIKAHVREADAKAKRILEGHPPSPVHGN